MVWETKRHEDEVRNLKYKIDSLNSEMSIYSTQRIEKETKIIELDHLIGQILNVNETLVQQLSKNSTNSTITSKGLKQKSTISNNISIDNSKKKKKRSVSAPRVADIGTVSSELKSNLSSNLNLEKEILKKTKERKDINNENGINRLHEMHNMYVTLAKSITGKDESQSKRNLNGIRRRSISEERDKGILKGKKKDTSMKQRLKRGKDNVVGIAWSDKDDDISSKYSEGSIPIYNETNNFQNNKNSNNVNVGTLDLQRVIQSLEEEFEGLSEEYNRLLNGNGNTGEDKSRELVSVIQRLHKKGEQLRTLKSSPIKG